MIEDFFSSWRVNLRTQTLQKEPVSDAWSKLGGRVLLARILLDEVPPTCDPLGPDNKLIFAPGFLTGTPLVNTSRLSVGAKSPLTGGIKEANVGGDPGQDLMKLGYRAIVVEGTKHMFRLDRLGKKIKCGRGDTA